MKSELYISVDIETDGPVPGLHSMLSIGAAAIRDGEIVSTFSVNLDRLPNSEQDSDTMLDFWARFPAAYKATRVDTVHPSTALVRFCLWIKNLKEPDEIPVFIAYPITYDFSWMFYYGMNFARKQWWDVFNFQGMDIKSYAMATMGTMYSYSDKSHWPHSWKTKTNNNIHVALDDAIEQANQFIAMSQANAILQASSKGYFTQPLAPQTQQIEVTKEPMKAEYYMGQKQPNE